MQSESELWRMPISGRCTAPPADTVLDYTRHHAYDRNVQVPWLRTSILPHFESSEMPSSIFVESNPTAVPQQQAQEEGSGPTKDGSGIALSLRLANNNLRCDGGGELLATMLVSMIHRRHAALLKHGGDRNCDKAVHASHSELPSSPSSASCPARIVELDVSNTGALDAPGMWIRCLSDNSLHPFLQRLTANDEVLHPHSCAPLLTALGSAVQTLTHLSLRRCLLHQGSMEALAQGLMHAQCGVLVHLDLAENDITSQGLAHLCAALYDGCVRGRSAIAVLNVADNVVVAADRPVSGAGKGVRYCRNGLLGLALLVLHAPALAEVCLSGNQLGASYEGWPAGCDHGGASEVCEAARRSASAGQRKPPAIDLRNNQFDVTTRESLSRCSGFTAKLN